MQHKHVHDVDDRELVQSLAARLKKATDEEDARDLCKLIIKTTRRKKLTLAEDSPLTHEKEKAHPHLKALSTVLDGYFVARMDGKLYVQRAIFLARGIYQHR
jgi:hypothetical protein